jgi:hypothetical protein
VGPFCDIKGLVQTGIFKLGNECQRGKPLFSLSEYGLVVAASFFCHGGLPFGDRSLQIKKEDIMEQFRFLKPGWWVLHLVAISLVFWLGHTIRF